MIQQQPDVLMVLHCTVSGENKDLLGVDETAITELNWITINAIENKVLLTVFFSFKETFSLAQLVHDVRTTLDGRCCDVKTLKRRPYYVVLTLCAGWVDGIFGGWQYTRDEMKIQVILFILFFTKFSFFSLSLSPTHILIW